MIEEILDLENLARAWTALAASAAFVHRRSLIRRASRREEKQWKQPRSRKGYWRMSRNSNVRMALNNRWLEKQGVPDMEAIWIALHYGPKARV